MRRARLLGLILMAMFALSAVASTAASAEALKPNFLPETFPIHFKDKSGKGTFQIKGGGTILCLKDTSKGETTEGMGGKFKVLFEECENTATKITCTGLLATEKDPAGTILVEGTFQLRYTLLTPVKEKVAVLFLINEVHFECSIVLVRVKGCAAGFLLEPNILSKTLGVDLTQSGGKNAITSVATENNGGMENCILEGAEGAKAFEQAGEETNETIEGFENPKAESIEVLIMA